MRFLREYWFEIVCVIVGTLMGLAVAWSVPDYPDEPELFLQR